MQVYIININLLVMLILMIYKLCSKRFAFWLLTSHFKSNDYIVVNRGLTG